MSTVCAAALLFCASGLGDDLPTVKLDRDDLEIKQSCRIEIAPNAVIADANDNGVIQVDADDVAIEFAGAALRGTAAGTRPDEYKGYAIRIDGHRGVTIRGGKFSGFWCAVHATNAAGLTLDGVDGSDNRRAHLNSTPAAEDSGDWLFPHDNEDDQWLKNYAAAFYIKGSDDVTVKKCRVRHGQNALCLVRSNEARVYDNDFSFNSGWGVALYRSSRATIARNAIDFCIRGYSHDVYNRGQDSAGILMFEQCCDNVIAENSVTHGGDGFFGFAGREAIGEAGEHELDWYKRRGCNDNQLIANDFSSAAAHGIEMTFSFGNRFVRNRLADNAICGVWGGYSQETVIAANEFESNGGMAYGLERGGINIEYGQKNLVWENNFKSNRCGVHYWVNDKSDFTDRPWGKINGVGSSRNIVVSNSFDHDELAFHLRGAVDVMLDNNSLEGVKRELDADPRATIERISREAAPPPKFQAPTYEPFGETQPVGKRAELAGRDKIIMTEWGPWDHTSPLIRLVKSTGDSAIYDTHKISGEVFGRASGSGVKGRWDGSVTNGEGRYEVSATERGVHPYELLIGGGDFSETIHGMLVSTTWDATFFKWADETDPRKSPDAWRALASQSNAVRAELKQLTLRFGHAGPSELKISDSVTAAKIGGDHFGLIARTNLPLPRGNWKISTLSDDGVRVLVDGKPVIDNFTWHVPTRDTGTFSTDADRSVGITVEYFEIDGFAVLELELSPA